MSAPAQLDVFRRTIEHLQVGVLVQGPRAEIRLSNPMALELLGLTEDQLLGRSSFDPDWNVIHEDGTPFPGESHPVPVSIRERRPVRSVVMGVHRPRQDDRVWLLVNAEPELDAAGEVVQVFCTFTDITERKQLERAFVEAQKLEVVGQMASGLAHDFNNLLCVLIGVADVVARRLDPASPLQSEIAMLSRAAERGSGLTRQLLAFAGKSRTTEPRVLAVEESLRSLRTLLSPLLGEGVSLRVRVEEPDLRVRIDPGRFEQILLNLTLNARDAMPTGGTLTLGVRRGGVGDDEQVELVVSDTGTGIAPEHLSKVFEPFFTTKDEGKGTGLGLPMVREVVREAGGRVWIESERGRGTQVHLLLPRAYRSVEPASDPPASRGRERILVVEDDAVLRRLLSRSLEELGYEVLVAADGDDALEPAATVDLVISDVVMPNFDGGRMKRTLESVRTDVKVLLVSGHGDDALSQLGIDPREVLRKPFTPSELARRVRALLDSVA